MKKQHWIIAGIGLSAFSFIAYLIIQAQGNPLVFDIKVQSAVFDLRNASLTRVMTVITYTTNWQTVTIICAVLCFLQRTRKSFGIPLAFAALLSSGLYRLLKEIFTRPRPDISLRLAEAGGYSFPSGHAMTGLVFYGLMLLLLLYFFRSNNPKQDKVNLKTPLPPGCDNQNRIGNLEKALCIFFTLHIFLVGSSRVYLGVHWPTDVLAGWFLGLVLLTLLWHFFTRSRK